MTVESEETRDVLRCPHCRLVQFRTKNSRCRKCGLPTGADELKDVAEIVSPGNQPRQEQPARPHRPQPLSALIGGRVRERRALLGLSQRELAERMNVCRIYISKLELGRLIPLTDNLGRIAGGLGISIKELLRDEYSDRFDAVNAVWSDPLLTEIALMMGKLSDLERSLIILRARDLAELAADKRLVSSQKRAV